MTATTKPVDVTSRFNANVFPVTESGCWLWSGNTNTRHGYGAITVNGRTWRAHRLAWTLFRGEIPPLMCVCHKCDTPPCVNPDHLFLDTNEGNIADRVRKGRTVAGRTGAWNPGKHETHHKAKLSESQVEEIRRLANEGMLSQRQIAAHFGVSQANVSMIKNGWIWYEGRRHRGWGPKAAQQEKVGCIE